MNIISSIISGTVYLIGAGPGDPELITVKGLRLVRVADVLLYDRLVHPDLIDEAPARTEKIYVGKAPGRPSVSQENINTLLIEAAKRHRCVVRLKGGDPFVFGRGSEEAEALAKAEISFEVIPGLSSAYAVPAYAGIPMTHRGISHSFSVVTGHRALGESKADLEALVGAETLVILMGMSRIGEISRRLIDAGQPPHTPAAVVSQGCTHRQKTVLGTLSTIAERAGHLPAPAIIVIGQVVHLHQTIKWREEHDISSKNTLFSFIDHLIAKSA